MTLTGGQLWERSADRQSPDEPTLASSLFSKQRQSCPLVKSADEWNGRSSRVVFCGTTSGISDGSIVADDVLWDLLHACSNRDQLQIPNDALCLLLRRLGWSAISFSHGHAVFNDVESHRGSAVGVSPSSFCDRCTCLAAAHYSLTVLLSSLM